MNCDSRDGARCSAAKAFLHPARNRSNLHLWSNAYVTKINFSDDKKAESVIILKGDEEKLVKAKREIILSAGAINSAKLLLLSGVGPKEQLTDLQIEPIADLPVGQNFHDNPISFGVHFSTNMTVDSNHTLSEQDLNDFFINGTGPLSHFEKSVVRESTKWAENDSLPDIQVFMDSSSFANFDNEEVAEKVLGIKREIWTQFYKPYSGI